MDYELSAKEKRRRELILNREFANTNLSDETLSKTLASLRDMPTVSLIKPPSSIFTPEEKNQLYDQITSSSVLQKQSELVRAWFQLRFQDIMERGHIPSHIEILVLHKVFGNELAAAITEMVVKVFKELDSEEKEYVLGPKNEIEAIIFTGLLSEGKVHENSDKP